MMGCLKKQWRVQPGLAEGRSVTFSPSVSVSIEMTDSQEPEQAQAVQAGCIGIEHTGSLSLLPLFFIQEAECR